MRERLYTTRCTVCAAPCPGTDDQDNAWCRWCFAQYVAWSEVRPLGVLDFLADVAATARARRVVWEED